MAKMKQGFCRPFGINRLRACGMLAKSCRHTGVFGLLWFACALAVVAMVPARAQMSEVVLHNFTTMPKGANPAGVIRDPAGNLYGTTNRGGPAGYGVVYRVGTTGHQTVLHSFTGGLDGANPQSPLIGDAAGNLFGTTAGGGISNATCSGCGVIYRLDTVGHETVLYSFTGGADGADPSAGVIRDSAGNLYGTTAGGGTGRGVVFKLNPNNQETVLYTFTGGADGMGPAGVIRDLAGNLYGSTFRGGTADYGVVYNRTRCARWCPYPW